MTKEELQYLRRCEMAALIGWILAISFGGTLLVISTYDLL